MPWQTSSAKGNKDEHFKYQYHPGGDKNKAPKNAPSALNSVIIPNVTLPKVGHIYGSETWCYATWLLILWYSRAGMTSSTSGGRMNTTFDVEPIGKETVTTVVSDSSVLLYIV